MATWAYINLKGLSEYLEDLASAEADVDAASRDALFEGAQDIQDEMRSLVPILTGRLFQHIEVKGPITEGNYHYCEVGVIHDIAFTPKDVAIQANVIEYGSTRQAAQPFVRPAIARSKKVIVEKMKQILTRYGLSK